MIASLPLPPSINAYWRPTKRGGIYKTMDAKTWEIEAGFELNKKRIEFGKKKVEVFYDYYFKDNRSDLGNRTKILQDLFEKVGIIDNDRQVFLLHERKQFSKKNPRVEIKIREFKAG